MKLICKEKLPGFTPGKSYIGLVNNDNIAILNNRSVTIVFTLKMALNCFDINKGDKNV